MLHGRSEKPIAGTETEDGGGTVSSVLWVVSSEFWISAEVSGGVSAFR